MSTESTEPDWQPPTTSRPLLTRARPVFSLKFTLERFRQRMLLIGTAAAVMYGAIAFVVLLIGWMWIDVVFDLPGSLRIFGWLTAAIGLFLLTTRIALRFVREGNEANVASRLDRVAGTGGEIRSGFDLLPFRSRLDISRSRGKAQQLRPDRPALTRGLETLAIDKASLLASRIDDEDAVPIGPVAKSMFGLFGIGFIVLIVATFLPRMAYTELVRFVDPFGDHPAYSQYHFEISPSLMDVVYGENLDFEIEAEGPMIEQLEVVLVPPASQRDVALDEATPIDVLPAFPSSDGIWRATIANITADFDLYVRVRDARSSVHPVHVITVPQIEDVHAEITPPLYTGQVTYTTLIDARGIKGLPGTQVQLVAASNRPLSGGRLTLFGELEGDSTGIETMGIDVTEQSFQQQTNVHTVASAFTLSRQNRLVVEVIDESGQESTEAFDAPIEVLIDEHPIVRLRQPQSISFATPSAKLPIVVAAEDDYGLRRCQLFRSLNDSRYLPTDLDLPDGVPTRAEVSATLDLAAYGLESGDEIKVFARAVDNDPHGPEGDVGKGTESAIATIRIIAEEELQALQRREAGIQMLVNKYQQAQRRLESTASEIEELEKKLADADPNSPLSDEIREQLSALSNEFKEQAEAIEQLSKMALELDIDNELSPELAKLAEQLKAMHEAASQSVGNSQLTNKELQQQLQQQREALEKAHQDNAETALEPLKHLQQVLPLKQAENEFIQIVARQRDMAERLSALRDFDGGDDPPKRARIRELEEEQRLLQDNLTDLLDRIEEHAYGLPEDETLEELRQTALDFAAAVRDSGAIEAMIDASGALGQFNGADGYIAADRAADLLEQMLSQCDGMGKQCENCLPKFSPGLGSSLQKTMQQLCPTPGSGTMPGSGMGVGLGGQGGYSSRSSTMQNVGIYGGLPMMTPAGMSADGSMDLDNQAGGGPGVLGSDGTGGGSQFDSSQTNPAFGGAEWGVPHKYRRQSGRYLRRLARELEE